MQRFAWPYALPALFAVLLVTVIGVGLPPFAYVAVVLLAVVALGTVAVVLSRTLHALGNHRGMTRAISDYADSAICLVNHRGLITSVTLPGAEILGMAEHEAVGKPAREVILLEEHEPGELSWLAAGLARNVVHGQGTLTTPGGKVTVTYTAGPLMADGRFMGVILLLSDLATKRDAEARRAAERQYRELVEASPDGMVLTDAYGYVLLANPRAAALHGYDESDDLVGKRLVELAQQQSRSGLAATMRQVLEDGRLQTCEYVGVRHSGDTFPAEAGLARVTDGAVTSGLLLVIRDVSRHKDALATIEINRERTVLQQAVAGVLAHGASLSEAMPNLLQIIAENGQWDAACFWQLDTQENALRRHSVWFRPEAALGPHLDAVKKLTISRAAGAVGQSLAGCAPVWIEDLMAGDCDEHLLARAARFQSTFCFPLRAGGEIQGVIEFVSRELKARDQAAIDTVEAVGPILAQFINRKEAERQLEHRALHDMLTDLPNRTLFNTRLERALTVAATSSRSLAVLLMDLDRFKEVNDTFGHLHGDALLKQAARRLNAAVRDTDTVARLGGDEFAVLLPSTEEEGALNVARKFLTCMEQPFLIEGMNLDVGMSIGVALYPEHGQDATGLTKHADVAMYQAKRSNLGYAVYASNSDQHTPSRLALTSELRRAIEENELFLMYQPKMDIRTGEVDVVEALVRWNHPTRGLVRPDDFIPLAEETGLIRPLTAWVIRETLRQLAVWRESGVDLRVAINISAQNLHDPRLVPTTRQLLSDRGIDPDRLSVEVTESSVMVDKEAARQTLVSLDRLGVQISIDDFGTGYSSLSYLNHLPAHEIKIDSSFVLDMLEDGNGAFIAQSVIDLGHKLGLRVVAEGVENLETYDLLAAMDCDQIQGFYLSPPLPAADVSQWVRDHGLTSSRSKIIRLDLA